MDLQRIDSRLAWPLHDTAASRRIEAAALATAAPHALMQRAGEATARLALALFPHARHILVCCGPGNNGGDGLVAARILHQAGKVVSAVLLADDPGRMPTDAARALHDAQAAGVAIEPELGQRAADPGCDLVVDALLGLGSRRAAEGRIACTMQAVQAAGLPVIAVDLPTGLDADTGALHGHLALRAQATLSLLTLKPGLFTGHGRDLAGQVWLDRLGIKTAGATARLSGRRDAAVAARPQSSHKGSFGDVAVVGGAPGMVGAAWLAARAALSAGAGRVYCSLLDEQAPMLDPNRPELMGRTRWWASPASVLASTTVACGCGGGDAVRDALPALLAHAGRLVLDADALNAVAADASLQDLLVARAAQPPQAPNTVITPHPLEAARLLGCSAADVQRDRLAAAARLAERWRVVVVLKGSGTVIAAPGALPVINPTGNALLATAGTGDVLAGWLAGRWAQWPAGAGAAQAAAVAAVWQHGEAADRAAEAGRSSPLLAADLIAALSGPSGR